MKRILFLILFLSVQLLSAQQLIHRSIFDVCYSESKQQPLWLEYEVECNESGYSRKGLNFEQDKAFKGITSNNADYYRNVWDKGHLAPAADFNCDYEKLKATFNYLNCALQHEKLNRGPWKNLEKYERELSREYKVNVRIELEFDANSLQLETAALVPSYFIKILSYNDKVRVFRFPNNITVSNQLFQDYEMQEPYTIIKGCTERYDWGNNESWPSTNSKPSTPRKEFNYLPSSTTNQLVFHTSFALSYSEKWEQAEWVAYELTKNRVNKKNNPPSDFKFKEDNKVNSGSATESDYKDSGYDKGHLMNSALWQEQLFSENILMSTISPQDPLLVNQSQYSPGIWKKLEQQVEAWAVDKGQIYVVSGGVLESCTSSIGNNVGVPAFFYKIILDYNQEDPKAIAFVVANERATKSIRNYVTSIDYVESITGIDFFPELPDDLENKLESKSDVKKWYWR